MLINLFKADKISGFFPAAQKADSLVDKVSKLFRAIISAVKHSVGLVARSLKKKNPKTTIEKLAFAANYEVSRIKEAVEPFKDFVVKNKSTIIKIVIAAAVVTGAVYAHRLQTPPDDLRFPDGGGSFLGKVLFSGYLAGGALGIVYAATAAHFAPAPASPFDPASLFDPAPAPASPFDPASLFDPAPPAPARYRGASPFDPASLFDPAPPAPAKYRGASNVMNTEEVELSENLYESIKEYRDLILNILNSFDPRSVEGARHDKIEALEKPNINKLVIGAEMALKSNNLESLKAICTNLMDLYSTLDDYKIRQIEGEEGEVQIEGEEGEVQIEGEEGEVQIEGEEGEEGEVQIEGEIR